MINLNKLINKNKKLFKNYKKKMMRILQNNQKIILIVIYNRMN